MRNKTGTFRLMFMLVLIFALTAFPVPVSANHSWGNYHWARTSNPFTVRVIDSMTSDWDDNLNTAISDWNASSVLNVVKEAGDSSSNTRRRCRPVSGKVRACNSTYGNNGWLGLAQIWITGSVHIYQATTKVNDTYLASSSYTETNRQHVLCQEIGHDWGLDHQDESGADLNTCMDYDDALGNAHPNQHDYQQLQTIYNSHLDSFNSYNGSGTSVPKGFADADVHAQENWGTKVHESADGHSAIFVHDFGNGNQIYTFVFWAK
jgi:hypothetical protein